MAKKLVDIEAKIKSREKEFLPYLKKLLDKEVYDFIMQLSKMGPAYLFSGIIRDYFLGRNEVRDVDIMIHTNKNIELLLSKYEHRRNSFGGYKISIGNTVIDLWYLQNTWGLQAKQVIEPELASEIPRTAFFNFSSILFSFKHKKFIYTTDFLRFLRDKKIDYVFEPNANYALCVVNSFYYRDKLNLKLDDKLKLYLKKLDKTNSPEYENVQRKHFGKVLYKRQYLQNEIRNMIVVKRQKKRKPVRGLPTLY